MLPARTALLLSVAIGVALEVGTFGTRLGLPLAIVASVAIGLFASGRGWLAPYFIALAQFGAAFYRGGRLASSWIGPLGYYAAFGCVFLIAAYAGHRFQRFRVR